MGPEQEIHPADHVGEALGGDEEEQVLGQAG